MAYKESIETDGGEPDLDEEARFLDGEESKGILGLGARFEEGDKVVIKHSGRNATVEQVENPVYTKIYMNILNAIGVRNSGTDASYRISYEVDGSKRHTVLRERHLARSDEDDR